MQNAPAIILVRPQLGENIGMTARAMKNCMVHELRLVSPRDGWPNEKAWHPASGADDILENAKVYNTVADATADLHFTLATTARLRGMTKHVMTPDMAAKDITQRSLQNQKCGILFGAERTGLENDEIALSTSILNIPLNPEFSSLNIAQAVLLVCHMWYSEAHSALYNKAALRSNASLPAPKEKLDFLISRLEEELVKAQFFKNPEMQEPMMLNLKSTFARMEMTTQEIQTFHGIISALIEKK
jgi:tRNA/rRNA methyltransferase